MKNAIIVHGKPTEERYNNPGLPKPHEANWLPWLGARFKEIDISASIPAMPRPFFPDYQAWKEVFDTLPVNSDSGLIGHSAGAEFILRWLSEHPNVDVASVALVAPYRDEALKYGDFSQYELDSTIAERVGKLLIFNSTNDSDAIQHNARSLAQRFDRTLLSSCLIELPDYRHFMVPEFPELYESLV